MLRGLVSVRKLFKILANISYSLHPFKLQLGLKLDQDMG